METIRPVTIFYYLDIAGRLATRHVSLCTVDDSVGVLYFNLTDICCNLNDGVESILNAGINDTANGQNQFNFRVLNETKDVFYSRSKIL